MYLDNDAFYIRTKWEREAFGEMEIYERLEELHKMTIKLLVKQGSFPEVRNNLKRYKPEYFADIIQQLVKISAENEHHEMTAYLLDYQYKHKLFNQTELRL